MRKGTIIILTIALSLLLTTAVLAVSNPSQIIAGLTGKAESDVYAERTSGKTFGQVAQENQVYDQFKQEMLRYKNEIIDQRVASGSLTQENGDALKKAMEERMNACTGTPDQSRDRLGQKFGGGMGFGKGQGRGMMGQGMGMSQGMGFGRGVAK